MSRITLIWKAVTDIEVPEGQDPIEVRETINNGDATLPGWMTDQMFRVQTEVVDWRVTSCTS